jgi:membrane dipeptidase
MNGDPATGVTGGDTLTSGEALHAESIVVNGLAQPGHLPKAFDAMIAGGITATNLTVAANEGSIEGTRRVEQALAALEAHRSSDRLRVVTTGEEIRRAKNDGVNGVIIGFQNADPIEDDLTFLSVFYRLGLRILQLTYQRRNLLVDG